MIKSRLLIGYCAQRFRAHGEAAHDFLSRFMNLFSSFPIMRGEIEISGQITYWVRADINPVADI